MKSAFYPFDDRLVIIDTMIKPGFAAFLDGTPVGPENRRSRQGD